METFDRSSLKTYYLRRDYSGQYEPHWHMVDEPYAHPRPTAVLGDAPASSQSHLLLKELSESVQCLDDDRIPPATGGQCPKQNFEPSGTSGGSAEERLAPGWFARG